MRQHHLGFCWALREHNTTKKNSRLIRAFCDFSIFLVFFVVVFPFLYSLPLIQQLSVCSSLLLSFLFPCLRSVYSRNTEAPERHTAAILSVRYFFPPPFFYLRGFFCFF